MLPSWSVAVRPESLQLVTSCVKLPLSLSAKQFSTAPENTNPYKRYIFYMTHYFESVEICLLTTVSNIFYMTIIFKVLKYGLKELQYLSLPDDFPTKLPLARATRLVSRQ